MVFLISEQTFHLLQLNSTYFFVMVDRPSGGRRAHLKLSKEVNQWPSEKYMFAPFLITSAVIPISRRSAGTHVPLENVLFEEMHSGLQDGRAAVALSSHPHGHFKHLLK